MATKQNGVLGTFTPTVTGYKIYCTIKFSNFIPAKNPKIKTKVRNTKLPSKIYLINSMLYI